MADSKKGTLTGILITVGGLAVSLAALLVIFVLLRSASQSAQNELNLARLQQFSIHMDAADWHMVSDPSYLASSTNSIQADEAQIDAILADLSNHSDAGLLTPVRDAYQSYRGSVAEELRLFSAGNAAAAADLNQTRVDPGYGRLEAATRRAVTNFDNIAVRDRQRAYLGSAITIFTAILLTGFFFWRYDHVRHVNVRMETERQILRQMSLVDDLTGLYNRRGFLALAEQQLKTAIRDGRRPIILFADLDNMKWINDNLGHAAGDMALTATAGVLRQTFRESDIIARMGGDEFVIFALEAPGANAGAPLLRLRRALEEYNLSSGSPFRIDLSTGEAQYDPERPLSIEELISAADRRMYEQKERRKSGG